MEHQQDLPLVASGTGPIAPSTGSAGGDTEPMEDESIRQPVVAYFTFVQNNLHQLASGNATQVIREAEQRHMQVMNEVLQNMRNEMALRLTQKDQECMQRVQDAESSAIGAHLAATHEARKHVEELEARLKKAEALHLSTVEEIMKDANARHDRKIEEQRVKISKEFEEAQKQTVEHAHTLIFQNPLNKERHLK